METYVEFVHLKWYDLFAWTCVCVVFILFSWFFITKTKSVHFMHLWHLQLCACLDECPTFPMWNGHGNKFVSYCSRHWSSHTTHNISHLCSNWIDFQGWQSHFWDCSWFMNSIFFPYFFRIFSMLGFSFTSIYHWIRTAIQPWWRRLKWKYCFYISFTWNDINFIMIFFLFATSQQQENWFCPPLITSIEGFPIDDGWDAASTIQSLRVILWMREDSQIFQFLFGHCNIYNKFHKYLASYCFGHKWSLSLQRKISHTDTEGYKQFQCILMFQIGRSFGCARKLRK